jgi:hypothetical protein
MVTMRLLFSVLCMIILLSACGQDRVASDDPQRDAAQALDRKRDFEKAIVGKSFRGEGVDVTVAEGGALVGTHLGQPFVGSWEYRRGLVCTSLSSVDVRKAADRTCYRAAIDRREVILVPVVED